MTDATAAASSPFSINIAAVRSSGESITRVTSRNDPAANTKESGMGATAGIELA
jgi:hypothetical protein